jgi:hypothetical protein
MKWKIYWIALAVMLVHVVTFSAHAWDNHPSEGWRSIYASRGIALRDRPGYYRVSGRNEHTYLSEIALQRLGVASLFGVNGNAQMRVVDLNARWLRPALESTEHIGDDSVTELEERTLPLPAQFSGLPDYSYTIYDWINKNRYCPPGIPPSIAPLERCHEYTLWLGAAFNSVHFGEQAKHMYQRLHQIALGMALQARTLRARLWEKGSVKERDAYVVCVKEAEIAALAYEGVAQHFLQDHWSTGHMWNRWNGGEYRLLAYKDWRFDAFVGMFTGVVHGTEAITAFSDPMSGPWTYGNKRHPVTWVDPTNRIYGGIGDEHIDDLFFNPFPIEGSRSPNPEKNVNTQRERLLQCSMSGWASVIRTFGRNSRGYGAWQAELAADAPGDDMVNSDLCWENWMTNFSIMLGLITLLGEPDIDPIDLLTDKPEDPSLPADPIERLNTLLTKDKFNIAKIPRLRAIVGAAAPGVDLLPLVLSNEAKAIAATFNRPEIRRSIGQMYAPALLRFRRDPNGTELARGRLGNLGRAEPGNKYPLPSYLEPADLNTLPNRIN